MTDWLREAYEHSDAPRNAWRAAEDTCDATSTSQKTTQDHSEEHGP